MAQLILKDLVSGQPLRWREMHPSERYAYFRAQGEQIMYEGLCYRLKTVAWHLPAEECVLGVLNEPCPPDVFCED